MAEGSSYDILVIGGGINGCGIARDAAGRGYSVLLAEMDDLASGTSSRSTKLVHGGLRYLEQYRFGLVREALAEREVLWAMAPHIIRPMRFVLPHHRGIRPAWLLRLGLFLYDHIGGRRLLPPTKVLDLRRDEAGRPLKSQYVKAFEYSDCWADDARLVVLNARSAADLGADIRTRCKVVAAESGAAEWRVMLEDRQSGARETVAARFLVNAAGPWVDRVQAGALGSKGAHNVRLVQGSHIVVRRKYRHDRAYFFQNGDGRIFFAVPYEGDFTLIGTTDRDYAGDPAEVRITPGEIDYLCAGASEYFREAVTPADVVWSYSGVRPLYDDGSAKAQEATRDYVLKRDEAAGKAPLLEIFGGKITTYRRLAEDALERVDAALGGRRGPWTARATLPGGDFPPQAFEAEAAAFHRDYPFLDAAHARRLFRLYGTLARTILGSARGPADLGRRFGADLYEAEVDHLVRHEWAATADDILWRRTKRGLVLTGDEAAGLDAWLRARKEAA